VPVVSMMYFFVFSPPKITGEVRPAFCATSVKCATGFVSGVGAGVCELVMSGKFSDRANASPDRRTARGNRESKIIGRFVV
jgi:hypothetical protein